MPTIITGTVSFGASKVGRGTLGVTVFSQTGSILSARAVAAPTLEVGDGIYLVTVSVPDGTYGTVKVDTDEVSGQRNATFDFDVRPEGTTLVTGGNSGGSAWAIGQTYTFTVETVNPSQVPTDADALPTYRVYEGSSSGGAIPPLLTGTMVKRDDIGTTGFYEHGFLLSPSVGFEVGKVYTLLIAASVGGTVGNTTRSFQIVSTGVVLSSGVSLDMATGIGKLRFWIPDKGALALDNVTVTGTRYSDSELTYFLGLARTYSDNSPRVLLAASMALDQWANEVSQTATEETVSIFKDNSYLTYKALSERAKYLRLLDAQLLTSNPDASPLPGTTTLTSIAVTTTNSRFGWGGFLTKEPALGDW